MTIDWKLLLFEYKQDISLLVNIKPNHWRQEIAYSLCELYYLQYRTQLCYRYDQKIDLRPGSDFNRFMESHMKPLSKYRVWDALFPNYISANSSVAIDEALHLLVDSRIVDRVYSGDIVTVSKIVHSIEKKRSKYLDVL